MSATFIQEHDVYAAGTPVTTVQVSYSSDNIAGNLLILFASWVGAGITSVTDSAGNTWLNLPQIANPVCLGQMWYCLKCKAGPNTVTVTWPSNAIYHGVGVAEYSGVNALDAHAENSNQSASGSTETSVSLTTGRDNTLVVVGFSESQETTNAGIPLSNSFLLRTTNTTNTGCYLDRANVAAAGTSVSVTINAGGASGFGSSAASFYQSISAPQRTLVGAGI